MCAAKNILAQTSVTYRLPDPGELNQRILLRQRVDLPVRDYDVEPDYRNARYVWAKVRQVSATALLETAQIGNVVTHYITIRYRVGITTDYEVMIGRQLLRVKRSRDLNSARRYLLLECEELEDASIPTRGGNNADSLYTR